MLCFFLLLKNPPPPPYPGCRAQQRSLEVTEAEPSVCVTLAAALGVGEEKFC